MPLFRTSSQPQNLLTSDGLLVQGFLDGTPRAMLVRPVVDTASVPGDVLVSIEVQVDGKWYSVGFGGHRL